jgi:hypothetical protein
MGADRLELDVRSAADGTLVVLHDRTLARTAGDPRAVAAVGLADLRRSVPGRGPLTLDDVLGRYGAAAAYLIELKEPRPGDAALLLEVLGRHDVAGGCASSPSTPPACSRCTPGSRPCRWPSCTAGPGARAPCGAACPASPGGRARSRPPPPRWTPRSCSPPTTSGSPSRPGPSTTRRRWTGSWPSGSTGSSRTSRPGAVRGRRGPGDGPGGVDVACRAVHDLAVFLSWRGRFSDSPRAISAELLRRGPACARCGCSRRTPRRSRRGSSAWRPAPGGVRGARGGPLGRLERHADHGLAQAPGLLLPADLARDAAQAAGATTSRGLPTPAPCHHIRGRAARATWRSSTRMPPPTRSARGAARSFQLDRPKLRDGLSAAQRTPSTGPSRGRCARGCGRRWACSPHAGGPLRPDVAGLPSSHTSTASTSSSCGSARPPHHRAPGAPTATTARRP